MWCVLTADAVDVAVGVGAEGVLDRALGCAGYYPGKCQQQGRAAQQQAPAAASGHADTDRSERRGSAPVNRALREVETVRA